MTLIWGLEQKDYNAATSLLVDSDDMVTSGYAGSQTTVTGFYDPNATGSNAVQATLTTTAVAVCSTGALAHVGTFRVYAAPKGSAAGVQARLSWRAGRDQFTSNAYVTPPAAGRRCEVDLGMIRIPKAQQGAQTWEGRVEALSSATGDTLAVDYLALIPVGDVGGGKSGATSARSLPGAES